MLQLFVENIEQEQLTPAVLQQLHLITNLHTAQTQLLRFQTVILNLIKSDSEQTRLCYRNFLRVDADPIGEILDRNSPNSRKIATSHLRIVASSLQMVTCYCERFTIVTSYSRVIYGKINPRTLVRRFLTSQKIYLTFHGSLRVICELYRAIYGYQRVTYRCLRVTTSWPSIRTCEKNLCNACERGITQTMQNETIPSQTAHVNWTPPGTSNTIF